MHSFAGACTMERDGHYSFLTNNILRMNEICFEKGCHLEKKEQ